MCFDDIHYICSHACDTIKPEWKAESTVWCNGHNKSRDKNRDNKLRTQIPLLSKVKEGGWKAQKLLWITFPLEGLDIVPSQGWVPARGCVFCMPHSAGRDRLSHECSPRFLIPHSTGRTWQQTSIAFTNFAHSSTFPILQRPHSCVTCVKHIALAVRH